MDAKLQNVWVPEIGPGGLFTGTFEPEDCTLGTTITVWVCADDTNMVDESNENNNCEMNYFTCPILPQPDLTVTEMWEEYVDGQVTLHFTIENIGNADAGACDATLYINRVLVATQNVGVLGLGLDGTFNGAFAPMLCSPGTTNTVQVCIDDANVIDESNEGNNCLTNSFTCPILPQPDLVVFEKWEECVDGQVIVHFIIANIGDANAVASYASLFMFDMDVKLQNVEVPELGPNGFFTGTFAAEDCTLDTPFGVIVCADDTSVVNESNETNNCMINTFTCPLLPKPDLVVIEMWEEAVKADGHVIVHFIIENIGDAEAGESYATLYINDMLVEEQNVWVPALGLSGRFTSEFALELCPLDDNITVMVCADDTHVVDETNETNNCRTNNFICPPQGPDLVIEKTVEQRIVNCDTCGYRVSYTVTNIGNEVACGECVGGRNRVVLLLDGVDIARRNCRRLGPGASVSGDFGWRRDCPCADDFNVTVYVDYFNVVDEANETNNWDINLLHCGLGDIEVTKDVRNTTSNAWEDEILDAVRGDMVEFRGLVKNAGCCCELTNMMVTDELSASLEYVNATPIPHTTTYNADGTTTIEWPASVLGMCDTSEYRINATVIADCGWDENIMSATATTCTGTVVSDDDSAWVYAPTSAGVTVDKTVWDGTDWVDAITVADGTNLTFRCIVRNTGICQDLIYLTVWDTLTNDSLVYNWADGPQPPYPYGPQPPVVYVGADSTKVEWDLPWFVFIVPGEELVFLVNATANGIGNDVLRNRLDVAAGSWDWLTGDVVWVDANETVQITIT
jgi:subtilase family serine protease